MKFNNRTKTIHTDNHATNLIIYKQYQLSQIDVRSKTIWKTGLSKIEKNNLLRNSCLQSLHDRLLSQSLRLQFLTPSTLKLETFGLYYLQIEQAKNN